jgi:pimeloyl-ACP methyl ester carboxylesterase
MHACVSVDPAPARSLPVVLVHGIGVASRFMVPIAELLAPYHRVYAPDLPGFGKSGKPAHALNLIELTDALAGVGAQAGAGLTLGYYLVLRGWAVLEPREAGAASLILHRTRRGRPGECVGFYVRTSEHPPSETVWKIGIARS